LTVAALPETGDGAIWKPDPSFNVVDTILDNPEFVSVLRVVLRDAAAALKRNSLSCKTQARKLARRSRPSGKSEKPSERNATSLNGDLS
jgi:hypothetical protein